MKKTVRRLLLCSIVMTCLSMSYLSFYSFLHKNYAYTVHYDPLFSGSAQAEITAWAQSQHVSAPVLARALPSAFPCIKAVQYHRIPAGNYTISLTARLPRIMLNTSHVLTDGAVVPVHFFTTPSLQNIAEVACAQEMLTLSHSYWQPLLQLPAAFFEQYELTCESEITTRITCKDQPGYSIVADMQSLARGAVLPAVAKLYTAYCAKRNNNKKMQKIVQKVVYDIRFNNQILEYALRGSQYDSKQRVIS